MEDKGYRRDDILKLTRRYVQDVLFGVERDESGNPKFLNNTTATSGNYWDSIRGVLFGRGWPRHKIEQKIDELRKSVNAPKPTRKSGNERPRRKSPRR